MLALSEVWQGVVQNFNAYTTAPLVQPQSYEQTKLDADGNPAKDASGNEAKETVQVAQRHQWSSQRWGEYEIRPRWRQCIRCITSRANTRIARTFR